MLPSFFDRGVIKVSSLGAITTGATHADVLFTLDKFQRFVLILQGTGSDPVGTVEILLKYKVGSGSAAALATGMIVQVGYSTALISPLDNWTNVALTSGGKITIPTTLTDDPTFQYGVLLDVPCLAPLASQDDLVDQLAVGVKNNGTSSFTGTLLLVCEEPRY